MLRNCFIFCSFSKHLYLLETKLHLLFYFSFCNFFFVSFRSFVRSFISLLSQLIKITFSIWIEFYEFVHKITLFSSLALNVVACVSFFYYSFSNKIAMEFFRLVSFYYIFFCLVALVFSRGKTKLRIIKIWFCFTMLREYFFL